jgi:hypothetical protein
MKNKMIKICPFVNDPGPDCFCLEMNSRNIETVIRFCSGDYEACTIYQKQMKKDVLD